MKQQGLPGSNTLYARDLSASPIGKTKHAILDRDVWNGPCGHSSRGPTDISCSRAVVFPLNFSHVYRMITAWNSGRISLLADACPVIQLGAGHQPLFEAAQVAQAKRARLLFLNGGTCVLMNVAVQMGPYVARKWGCPSNGRRFIGRCPSNESPAGYMSGWRAGNLQLTACPVRSCLDTWFA